MPEPTTAGPARPARRFLLRAPASFDDGRGTVGSGFVENISRSGVLLAGCSPVPHPGARVWLRASYFPGSVEVALSGEVVRLTERGFALKFIDLTPVAERTISRILPV
jgi:hypothetical protein